MKPKLAKLTSTPEADAALSRMLEATTHDYRAGKISKTDLLSWIIRHFEKTSFDSSLGDIRQAFFDEVIYLDSLLKDLKVARRSGETSPSLNELLTKISAATQVSSKEGADK